MKTKTQPVPVCSGNYLEQALYKGLTKQQKSFAKMELAKHDDIEKAPIGQIRKSALKLKP